MNSVSVYLKSNLSYEVRIAAFTRLTPKECRVGGLLEVRESKTIRHKARVRRYAVQEVEPGMGGRRFKVTKPGGEEWYHLLLVPQTRQETYHRCECRGYETSGECTHLAALLTLCGAGHLPEPAPLPAPVANGG